MTTLRSENGWECLFSSDSRLTTVNIPTKNGVTRIRMRGGSVGLILAYYILLWDAFIEPVWGKLLDDWGWADRFIRGVVTMYSNHFSGTAVDVNATRHPLGKVGTVLKAALWRTIVSTRFRQDGVVLIRWGGDYHNRKDEMHGEIAPGVTMAQCEKLAKRIAKRRRGKAILELNPGMLRTINS